MFNEITLEWMVVARVWLDNQSEQGYRLAFKKVFDHCKQNYPNFSVGESLLSVIVDWSDAQVNRLKGAIAWG